MIITKIQGGLGNQMFQYALGRSLSIKNNTELKLDISQLSENIPNVTQRDYGLSVFNIKTAIATQDEVLYFKKYKRRSGHISLPFKIGYLPLPYNIFISNWNKYAIEKEFNFDPDVLKLGNNVYLEGWWNTERYFSHIRNVLLEDFTISNSLSGKNKETAHRIVTANSISIHVRRGDYVTNKDTNEYLGVCSLDYYRKGIAFMAEKVNSPKFFVFSDDIKWARENLPLSNDVLYVDWNDSKTAFEDLRLMSLCKHNIIANSSFSWWGAWLNRNETKIVIAPNRWFKNAKQSVSTEDIIPVSWIKM